MVENTNISEVMSGIKGVDSEVSSTFQFELSEYGNSVPFKIIKLEDAPDLLPMVIPQQGSSSKDLADISTLSNDDSISSAPLEKCVSTSYKHPFENEISSEEYSSESDMEIDTMNSENDSECENISDSDDPDPIERKNVVVPDVLDHDYVNKKISIRPPTPEWSLDQKSMKKIAFTKKQELLIPPPQTPYEAFRWFLNDEIIERIVQETNKNAVRVCNKPSMAPYSRCRAWKDVTHPEIVTFLALLIHTGTFRMNRIGDYWKKEYLFNWTCFTTFMKRNRFMLILNCLSFAYSNDSRDIIGKFRPIVQNFNNKMKEIYSPGKELFLTNPMALWYGRLVRQEHRDYSRRSDIINIYMLAESNGIVINYQVCAGDYDVNLLRVTSGAIVNELLENYLGNGHAVYMNRCYSSWKLAAHLLDQRTYCTGILSKNSRDNLFKETASDLSKKSNQSLFLDGVHIGKSMHNKPVFYISTEFDDKCQQVIDKDGIKTTKPKAIINYSKHMIDSELQDQLMSYYPCSRKYMRWTKKMFIHSMQIYMNNAYHLYNNYSGKKLSFYDFRVAILKAMLPKPKVIPPATVSATHVLTKITRTRLRIKSNRDGWLYHVNERVRKDCILCRQKKKRVSTVFECQGCKHSPGFCPGCFCQYHSETAS